MNLRSDAASGVMVVALATALWFAGGCTPKRPANPPAPPPPAYSGPEFLRTTVGSMTVINGFRRELVSGYGLVVGLNETGSADVPPALRDWLINEMSRRGFGKQSMGYGHMDPRRVLASDTTAVVLVEGILPPGAVKGARFDVRVSALPQTQTTSLVGGRLYTTDLSVQGRFPGRSGLPRASAHGDVFTNPFVEDAGEGRFSGPADPRSGRVLGGGVVQKDTLMALSLRQPSYPRSRMIEQRINGRFPQDPQDPQPMAVAKSDELIQINVLDRFRDDPQRMLELVSSLFVNPTEKFNRLKANELIDILDQPDNQQHAAKVALAWEAMGPIVLPILRPAYEHENPVVRFAALEAGARLGDRHAAEPLRTLAVTGDTGERDRATALLGLLLRENPDDTTILRTLREQLEDEDAFVRFAAFDALTRIDDVTTVTRRFGDRFELAMVRSSQPMIYVTRRDASRIVVFNQMLGFETPLLFTHDDNRLMIRLKPQAPEGERLAVRYRPLGESRGRTYNIPATVGNLVYLLANQPTRRNPSPGFGLRYSRIVAILQAMTEAGHIDAPFVLQPTDLIQRLASRRQGGGPALGRPETDTRAPEGDPSTPVDDPADDPANGESPTNIVPLEESGDNWLQ